MPGAFRLQAISDVTLVSVLGQAVIKDVADIVAGCEEQTGIAPEQRHLIVQRSHRTQVTQDAVMGDFTLALIQILGRKAGYAIGIELEITAAGVLRSQTDNAVQTSRLQSDPIGNLEDRIGGAQHGGDTAVLVENILQIGEAVPLLSAVVARIAAAVRRL